MSDPDVYRRLAALEKWRDQMASEELPIIAEGTWTPSFSFAGGGSVTYSTQSGYYVRRGPLVVFSLLIVLSGATTPTGNVFVDDFPFLTAQRSGAWAIQYDSINLSVGYSQIGGVLLPSTASILLRESGDNNSSQTIQGAAFGASSVLEMAGIAFV